LNELCYHKYCVERILVRVTGRTEDCSRAGKRGKKGPKAEKGRKEGLWQVISNVDLWLAADIAVHGIRKGPGTQKVGARYVPFRLQKKGHEATKGNGDIERNEIRRAPRRSSCERRNKEIAKEGKSQGSVGERRGGETD